MARNRIRYSWKWKKDEIIIIEANENHKEIKTIREKLINLEDKDYWCFWSGELICACFFFFFALLKFLIMKMYYFYKTDKLIFKKQSRMKNKPPTLLLSPQDMDKLLYSN